VKFHCSSFILRVRDPHVGDHVEFDVVTGENGRPRATGIRFL
jgi:hypothetical protein